MTLSNAAARPPRMSAAEQEFWRSALESRWGLHFGDGRLYQLRSQIRQRMQVHSLTTFAEYHRLLNGAQGPAEWQVLLESLLNHDTCFFRHPPSFAMLEQTLLPEVAARKADGDGPVSIWSAACSTGAEAYSLAMSALHCPALKTLPAAVEGTDISERALEQARTGVYPARVAASVPEPMLERHFVRETAGGQAQYRVRGALRTLVRFRNANLCDPRSWSRAFDVIFCQNVLIYFRQPVRDRTVDALAGCLNPGGFLVLAPGELPQPRIRGLKAMPVADVTVFRRSA